MTHHMKLDAEAGVVAPAIGTPVLNRSPYGDRAGWVAEVCEETANIHCLTGPNAGRQRLRISCVFENGTFSGQLGESIVAPWIEAAEKCDWIQPIDTNTAAEKLSEAKAKAAAEYRQRTEEREAGARAAAEYRDKYRDKIPTWAKAVIVAELEKDVSDIMTDYFSTRTERTIILAFSKHTRDLFPEMRKAAKNNPECAHLADADESGEHREKWSMGAGYYLTEGGKGRYSDGWRIRKRSLHLYGGQNDIAQALPFGEWSVPEETEEQAPKAERKAKPESEGAETAAGAFETVNGFTISEHVHTKRGFSMFIVETPDRVERDEYTRRLNAAKGLRGWYSRKWGSTPAGFAFKERAAAVKFAESLNV